MTKNVAIIGAHGQIARLVEKIIENRLLIVKKVLASRIQLLRVQINQYIKNKV